MRLCITMLTSTIVLQQSMSSAFSMDVLSPILQRVTKKSTSCQLYSLCGDSDHSKGTHNRRDVFRKGLTFASLVTTTLTSQVPIQSAAVAKNVKSRITGYEIQHTEAEWSNMLSKQQYFILREGGTESPYSSILEGEERDGLCE